MINNRLTLSISLGAFALGLFALFSSVLIWLQFNLEAPVWDMARLLPLIETATSEGLVATNWSDWFSLHSTAHRIAIIRALVYLGYAFLDGRNTFVYAGTAASILATLYVYHQAAYSALRNYRGASLFIVGLVLMLLCSPMQYWNLVTPICATWYYNIAFSSLGMWMLVKHLEHPRMIHVIAIMLLAAAAAFSNFSGVIFYLMLPIAAFILRSPYWMHFSLAAALFCAFYLLGIESSNHSLGNSDAFTAALKSMAEDKPQLFSNYGWFHQTAELLKTAPQGVFKHLGMPLTRHTPIFASIVVAASILVLCYYWLRLLLARIGKMSSPGYGTATTFFLSMATLQLGISISIWFGRIVMSSPTTPRYQSITIVYWLSFLFLILCETHSRSKTWTRNCMVIILAGVALLNVFTVLKPVGDLKLMYHQYQQEMLLRQLGITETTTVTGDTSATWRNVLTQHTAFVSKYSLKPISLHSLPASGATGEPCQNIALTVEATAVAGLRRATLTQENELDGVAREIYITGERNQIGRFYPAPPDNLWPSSLLQAPTKWIGFYLDEKDSDTLTIIFKSGKSTRHCQVVLSKE